MSQPDRNYPQQEEAEFDFDRFFRENRRPLARFIAKRVGAPDEVEDLASEVICQFIAYCQEHPEPASPRHRALLYKIARNRIVDYYTQRREKLREVPVEDAPPIVASGSVPRAIDAKRELAVALDALKDIHDTYREIIVLHANVGLSIGELADMMEKSPAHIRVILFRARRALKRELKKRGVL